ncbi:MAG: hypothetical protein J5449_13435, partial [Oscillospiraceae bacterium]|nr:hypothetical protein [Oscillospiraceae bacterium]
MAETLRGIPEAVSAREALLQVFAFSFTYEETAEMIEPIREAFPNLKVTGLSVYTANPPEIVRDEFIFDNTPMLRMSILFFERSTVRVLSYELDAADPSSVLERIRRELAATPRLKGVRVTISGFFLHVSGLLEKLTEGFEDIPFFGTMADVNFVTGAKSEPFVFDSEREYRHGVIFQLFTGEELHVDAQYIFGWKPIGKSMAITESKNELTMGDTAVATIDGAAPEEIYRKYLGVRFDRFLSLNCCEFPLVVERDGLLLGRTPFTFNENGEVIFIGSIRPNE